MDRQLNCSECGENYETGCNCETPTASEVGCSVLLAEEKSIAELPTKLELGGLTVETAEQVGNQITIKFTNSKKIVIDAVPDWWSCDLYVTDLIPS